MKFTVSQIVNAVNGKLLCGNENDIITSVSINSNNILENSLFVPIVGENTDAHKFICDALSNGAYACFTQYESLCNNHKSWILVEDTKKALQDLAKAYRSTLDIPIIGVTGSVGKTSTKEIIYSALASEKNVFKTPGNFNSQIGAPLSILQISDEHQIAVLEMGMSMFGEMQRLSDIVRPTHAVITNIGLSHIGNLKTQENIFKEKIRIRDFISDNQNIYLNCEDKILNEYNNSLDHKCKSFGFNSEFDVFAENISTNDNSMTFDLQLENNKSQKILMNVPGVHNVLNALAAICVSLDLGLDISNIKTGLAQYQSPDMRQKIYTLDKNIKLIDDSYNAGPDSMKTALALLKSVSKQKRKIAVLADMLELGDISSKTHFDLGYDVIRNDVNVLITIGPEAKYISDCTKQNAENITVKHFNNNTDAFSFLSSIISDDDIILVKGSRGMKTDEIVKNLLDSF